MRVPAPLFQEARLDCGRAFPGEFRVSLHVPTLYIYARHSTNYLAFTTMKILKKKKKKKERKIERKKKERKERKEETKKDRKEKKTKETL